MKYSLRSLMVVVTLVCVLLGALIGIRNLVSAVDAYWEREFENLARSKAGMPLLPTSQAPAPNPPKD